MKIKVRLARWLSLRIQEQTRKERRALRDYSRQELGRIRQAEIRSRGLRLYARKFYGRPEWIKEWNKYSKVRR
jgi:hypothetical protein